MSLHIGIVAAVLYLTVFPLFCPTPFPCIGPKNAGRPVCVPLPPVYAWWGDRVSIVSMEAVFSSQDPVCASCSMDLLKLFEMKSTMVDVYSQRTALKLKVIWGTKAGDVPCRGLLCSEYNGLQSSS